MTAIELFPRTTILGASEAAAVLGCDPYKTALDVYAAKVLPTTADTETRFTRWGRRLEAVVAEAYSEETGREIVADQTTARHRDHPCLAATPDYRVVGDGRLVEIKTGDKGTAHRWGEPGSGEVPEHVACQVVQQMAVCDVDAADVAVLLGGNDLRVYHLTRDRALETQLIEHLAGWWARHVVARVPPEPVDGAAAQRFVGRLFPQSVQDTIRTASAEEQERIRQLLDVRERIAALTNEEALMQAALKAAIGDGGGLGGPTGTVTWKSAKSGGPDWKAIATELGATPDLLARFQRPGSRRFLASAPKPALAAR